MIRSQASVGMSKCLESARSASVMSWSPIENPESYLLAEQPVTFPLVIGKELVEGGVVREFRVLLRVTSQIERLFLFPEASFHDQQPARSRRFVVVSHFRQ